MCWSGQERKGKGSPKIMGKTDAGIEEHSKPTHHAFAARPPLRICTLSMPQTHGMDFFLFLADAAAAQSAGHFMVWCSLSKEGAP
jgi:hypothetical protein